MVSVMSSCGVGCAKNDGTCNEQAASIADLLESQAIDFSSEVHHTITPEECLLHAVKLGNLQLGIDLVAEGIDVASADLKASDFPFLHIEQITGGITNILYRVTNTKNDAAVLVRLFGEDKEYSRRACNFPTGPKTSHIIDRKREYIICSELGVYGFCKAVYGLFNGGQVEEWIVGKCLEPLVLYSGEANAAIAKNLCKLHKFPNALRLYNVLFPQCWLTTPEVEALGFSNVRLNSPNESLLLQNLFAAAAPSQLPKLATLVVIATLVEPVESAAEFKSALWTKVDQFYKICTGAQDQIQKLLDKGFDFTSIEPAIPNVRRCCQEAKSKITICHADLHADNLVVNEGAVKFIDFEYANFMERGFDISNHFMEYAGFDCVWSRLPNEDRIKDFLVAYLQEDLAREPTPEEVAALRAEIKPFVPATHLFWGLWAIIQASYSSIDFDFTHYACQRLAQFIKNAQELQE